MPGYRTLQQALSRAVSADDGFPLMRVNGFAAAGSLTGGRRRVSTHLHWAWESLAKIVPLPVSGRVDRYWDVVPTGAV
jgi:hypothetical protein